MARRKRPVKKFGRSMRVKLMTLFSMFLVVLCGLIGRLMYIEHTKGEKYEKKVLSMQSYDSKTIPYQRGEIVDRRGTVLATSVAVYNVVLDCSVMTDKEEYIKPTIDALVKCFPDLDRGELEDYAEEKKDSRYIVLAKKVPYEEVQPFIEMQTAVDEKNKKVNPDIQGVWFEEYIRNYPYGSLASAVLGFTSNGETGLSGLENYYDDIISGVNGREYGYLNADSDLEKTVIPAQDGKTLVSSIDVNIQSIVEKKIKEFNEEYYNNYYEGAGSEHTAVIVMNPNNGEVLAMAQYPYFDCNDPWNLEDYYSKDEIDKMTDEKQVEILNTLWQNYCVTQTYEPGSVQKPFTVACGLETGTVKDKMSFECDGYEMFGGEKVSCVVRTGHGKESVRKALMDSCNDAIMQMGYKIGKENFTEYQGVFGFGQKTGIDLPGETNTSALVRTVDKMTPIDLATNAFGQNYNCTMIQMAAGFSSLINGGDYYQPHLVTKVMDSSGNTISTVEPKLVKQTVSESTSAQIKDYLYDVVSKGTGGTAKVDGYSMGGKTGTAQKQPRGNKQYLVSFIGFAPYDNPQMMIYCIVDEPNAKDEAHSYFAQNIVREIMEEVLPYMNIYPDEKKTGKNKGLGVTGENAQYTGKHQPVAKKNKKAEKTNGQEPAE